jgi:hypothetical protein
MRQILERGVQIAASARRRLIANATEEYRRLLPGAKGSGTPLGIEVAGRALVRRWLREFGNDVGPWP